MAHEGIHSPPTTPDQEAAYKFLHETEASAVPHNLHPVFQEAKAAQEALDSMEFDTIEEAQEAAVPIRNRLDAAVGEAGLGGKVVVLKGDRLYVPRPAVEADSGGFILHSSLLESPDIAIDIPSVSGQFLGFNLRYPAVTTGDTIHSCRPVLCYQVAVQPANHMINVYGSLCADGEVTTTEIDFEEDVAREKAAAAIKILLRTCPDDAKAIDEINRALSLAQPHGSHILQGVDRTVRKILSADLNSLDRSDTETALADLIKVRLHLGEEAKFKILTTQTMEKRWVTDDNGGEQLHPLSSSHPHPVLLNGGVSDVVYSTSMEGALENVPSDTVPYLVVNGEKLIYVPLGSIQLLERTR